MKSQPDGPMALEWQGLTRGMDKTLLDQARVFQRGLSLLTDRDESLTPVTCSYCGHHEVCEFAWDFYNTWGDCLASK